MRSTSVRRTALALVLLCGLTPLAGLAEQSPYYFGFQQTFGYDSNIFRLPDRTQVGNVVLEPQSSGLISTTLLMAGLDQPIGRQRLYGDLSLGYASYGSQSQLDNPTYRVVAGLDWDTREKVSGNLELRSGRRLGAYGDRDIPTGQGDNDERYDRVALVARLGDHLRSRIWLQADLVWDRLRNDVAYLTPVPIGTTPPLRETDGYERDDEAVALAFGVRYRWLGSTILGAGLRTESRNLEVAQRLTSPAEKVGSTVDSRRNDIDFFLEHQSGAHELHARLSYGDTDFADPRADGVRDWTGQMRWLWRPSGKLASDMRLLYDTEDRDQGSSSPADSGGARQTAAIEWRLDYALTTKVGAYLASALYRRDYGTGVGAFTDRDTSLTIGATWDALRNTTLGCAAGTARRTSTLVNNFGRNEYDAVLANCYIRVLLLR